MHNIREYLKKKEKAEKSEESHFRIKILKHKLNILYRAVLIVAAITAVAVVLGIQINNRVYTEYRVVSSVEWPEVSDVTYKNYNGNILGYSKDGATCTDAKGTQLWNQTYEMQSPLVNINGDYVALGDYNGQTIYVMNSSGTKGQIDTKMPIRYFKISTQGIVAAVLDDSDTTWIYLFDSAGNTIAYVKATMKQSGYPVAMSISDNSEKVAISYLYVDSGSITSSVAFYNFGAVGQNEIDNFVSGYDYLDSVVPVVEFMNDNTAFAVADNRLMLYKGSQKPVNDADILLEDNIQGVYYSDKYIGLVYLNATGETKYKMDIYNTSGKVVTTKEYDIECTDIFFDEDNIVFYNETECRIETINGLVKYEGDFGDRVQVLIPTSRQSKFLAVFDNRIETLELN